MQYWGVAVATSLLFFACIVAHEMGHSLVAMRFGITVQSITLFAFGGLARISRDPDKPGHEACIALAGPAVSMALGGAFLGMFFLIQSSSEQAAGLALYLGQINLAVAVFNLIPGFPLDGGRVFRAIAWAISRNFRSATHIASWMGKAVGYLFIGGGLFLGFWERDILNGVWIAFIGWFLKNAAAQSYAEVVFREGLRGINVRQIMNPDVPVIPKRLDLRTVVENHIFFTGRRCFLVGEEGRREGLLCLQDIKAVPKQEWSNVHAGDIMIPLSRIATIEPDDEALRAMEMMDKADVSQLPVTENGEIIGLVARDGIMRFLRLRSEFSGFP